MPEYEIEAKVTISTTAPDEEQAVVNAFEYIFGSADRGDFTYEVKLVKQ